MKNFWKFLPLIFCFLLLAAHFGRANILPLQIVSIIVPFLLFWKSKLAARIIQISLILGGIEWIRILIYYVRIRVTNGEDWLRLAIILGVVAILTAATALVFRTESMTERYGL